MAAVNLPTATELRERFLYDPLTGLVTHRGRSSNNTQPGMVAGTLCRSTGYWHLSLKSRRFGAHRAIWCMVTGEWPGQMQIDHINGLRDDNRWSNLRLATPDENRRHRSVDKRNVSGLKGVRLRGNKWRASVGGVELGTFDTAELAARAYDSAAKNMFGEFAKLNYP